MVAGILSRRFFSENNKTMIAVGLIRKWNTFNISLISLEMMMMCVPIWSCG